MNEEAIAAGASKATYTGAGSAVLGWFMSSEFGVLAGIVIGICGLCVNWYYKAKQDRRDHAEHERRMREGA